MVWCQEEMCVASTYTVAILDPLNIFNKID